MRNKEVTLGANGRNRLLKGINILGDAVKVTLGPKGRNVVIEGEFGRPPHITKDGVTVAKSIQLKDYVENMGAQLIKSVSEKTNTLAGDGTTTSTVLAQAMVNEGLKSVTSGMNPMDLKRGMDLALKQVLGFLPSLSTPVTEENLKRVTTISANSDDSIGSVVAEALLQVGTAGTITFGESSTQTDRVEIKQGYQFDNGWLASYFVTDLMKQEAVMYNPWIILINDDFNTVPEQFVKKVLEPILTDPSPRPILFIAKDVVDQAMATLVTNHVNGKLKCCAVRAPGFSDRRTQTLEDIAILVGATVVDPVKGVHLPDIGVDYLGTAEMVVVSKDKTSIIGGAGNIDLINDRLAQLESVLPTIEGDYDTEKMRSRIASLKGVSANIIIGAGTEVELKEKRDRFDDAIAAGRAALEEGIVAGGGAALLNLARTLKTLNPANEDQQAGVRIFQRALEVPFNQILLNAGLEPAAYRTQLTDSNVGVDASDGTVGNMIDKGIIDPAKVTRVSLEHSTSVAGLILTTEGTIALDPSESISADEQMAAARGFL